MILGIALIGLLALGTPLLAGEAVERANRAGEVLDEVMGTPESSIPQDLINKAHCVAVIPGVKKAGFIVGGRYGKGIISCRAPGNEAWTGPTAIRIEGGSVGFQIGGSSTDVVLLLMNKSGKNKLLSSRFTLGGDAAVAGGPVGRSAQAQTDAQMRAEILSYSRSRGVFAGVSLEGATLRQDADDNEELYGKPVTPNQILDGELAPPETVQPLMAALNRYSRHEH
jgi:lipid-binding SYLF domain-containing protein